VIVQVSPSVVTVVGTAPQEAVRTMTGHVVWTGVQVIVVTHGVAIVNV
jgi:hypothetical protein